MHYNGGQSSLREDTSQLAARDIDWYRRLPPGGLAAIRTALDALVYRTIPDYTHFPAIRAKLDRAALLNPQVNLIWQGNVVRAMLGTQQVGACEFVDYDHNEHYWLWAVKTEGAHQRQRIGKTMIHAGVERYRAVYASSAGKQEHEDIDEQDTRWLTQDGAALVNSCIAAGIMKREWLFNPFQEDDDQGDDFRDDE